MNIKALTLFLTEGNLREHFDYLRMMRLKYSVLVKSVPSLEGKEISSVIKSSFDPEIKTEAVNLLWQIKSHELFFDSFTDTPSLNINFKNNGISKEGFIYDILTMAKDKEWGFLYIYRDRKNNLVKSYTDKYDGAFCKYIPLLCLDLYEHTYFLDYRFKKEKYLRNALSNFNLGRLETT